MTPTESARPRRAYNSEVRRAQAGQTRERIIAAGSKLLQGAPVRDWSGVTVRAVAEQAGVNERTVYRHFSGERELRDSIIQRLEREADVDFDHIRLDRLAETAARVLRLVSVHPADPRPPLDPTLAETGRRRQNALLAAVGQEAPGWTAAARSMTAAALDLQWSVTAYERLVADWDLDEDQAIAAIAWVIDLIEDAIRQGRQPVTGDRRSFNRPG